MTTTQEQETPVASLNPLWFPASTFARIEPEMYFSRHLAQGRRPGTTRKFEEFREVVVHSGSLANTSKATIGSSVVRSGGTSVTCGIVAATTQTPGAGAVYPNVEILRGGFNSAPSTEEMVLSQRAFELLKAVAFPPENFLVRLAKGKEELEEYAEEDEVKVTVDEQWLVLTAHVQVLSRAGPPFDLIWRAIIAALKDVRLPLFNLDEDDERKLICLGNSQGPRFKFPVKSTILSSTFGVAEIEREGDSARPSAPVVLADLDGEIEESCVRSTINVVGDGSTLYGVSIGVVGTHSLRGKDVSEGLQIQRQQIAKALKLARERKN